jgi:hypothetical protein
MLCVCLLMLYRVLSDEVERYQVKMLRYVKIFALRGSVIRKFLPPLLIRTFIRLAHGDEVRFCNKQSRKSLPRPRTVHPLGDHGTSRPHETEGSS